MQIIKYRMCESMSWRMEHEHTKKEKLIGEENIISGGSFYPPGCNFNEMRQEVEKWR